jgi:hypothetical protein
MLCIHLPVDRRRGWSKIDLTCAVRFRFIILLLMVVMIKLVAMSSSFTSFTYEFFRP